MEKNEAQQARKLWQWRMLCALSRGSGRARKRIGTKRQDDLDFSSNLETWD